MQPTTDKSDRPTTSN